MRTVPQKRTGLWLPFGYIGPGGKEDKGKYCGNLINKTRNKGSEW